MNKIRLSKSSIGEFEKKAVLAVLEKEYLGMGEEVKLFEDEIKVYLQTDKDVVCVNTGTSALHLALSALGVGVGDEVLVPSLTYVASFQAISATGATPVACEVNADTVFLDIDDARKKITKNTKAIMPVHYASSSKGMNDVYALAKEFGLRVIEDAAQAFGSMRDGSLVGNDGDVICFSFDGIKNITSAEGGAILSIDKELIRKMQDARLLGVEKDTEKRYSGQRSWDFDVKEQGFRYHMSNVMAAIGRVQLIRLEEFGAKRKQIASNYINGLTNISKVKFLDFNFDENSSIAGFYGCNGASFAQLFVLIQNVSFAVGSDGKAGVSEESEYFEPNWYTAENEDLYMMTGNPIYLYSNASKQVWDERVGRTIAPNWLNLHEREYWKKYLPKGAATQYSTNVGVNRRGKLYGKPLRLGAEGAKREDNRQKLKL